MAPATLLGLAAVAAAMRLPITSVPPVVPQIADSAGLSTTAAGLLTTLPVLCFGLLAPVAPVLARRFGVTPLLGSVLVAVGAGALIRARPDIAPLFVGTVAVGAGVGVATVLLPSIVKRRLPHHAGLGSGLYGVALASGASLAAALTIPLQRLLDSGWTLVLAFWGVPALIAGVVVLARRAPERWRPLTPEPRSPWRDPVGWHVSGFTACQSLLYYTTMAWLPAMLVARGFTPEESGALLGIYSLVGLPLTLVVPALAGRRTHQGRDAVAVTALLTLGYVGLALAPAAALLWTVMVGAGAGGAHGLALMLIVARAPTDGYAARLAGMAQTVGYLVAAAGPVGIGLLHALSGGWELPLVVLAALCLPTFIFGMRAGRPSYANQSMAES